jgi:hypothetical protein
LAWCSTMGHMPRSKRIARTNRGVVVSFRLTEPEALTVAQLAEDNHETASQIIRRALYEYLERVRPS